MGIALIIVGGLALMTLFGAGFDYLGKKKGRNDKAVEARIEALEEKAKELEARMLEKDHKIEELESHIVFMNRLIEDKSAK